MTTNQLYHTLMQQLEQIVPQERITRKRVVTVQVSLARPQGFSAQLIQILKSKPLGSVQIQKFIR